MIVTTAKTWSDEITLTEHEIWEVRGGPVYITTEDSPESNMDGLRLWDRNFMKFLPGSKLKHRSDRENSVIVRMVVEG